MVPLILAAYLCARPIRQVGVVCIVLGLFRVILLDLQQVFNPTLDIRPNIQLDPAACMG